MDQNSAQSVVEQEDYMNDMTNIESKILVIRGQQVMLDRNLAELYGYEVKTLNQQVKRNISRFPADFMFELTREEIDLVKSQIVTSPNNNWYSGQGGGRRKGLHSICKGEPLRLWEGNEDG